jgi:hypothetical protein
LHDESVQQRTLRCDVCQAVRERLWTVAHCVVVKNIAPSLDKAAGMHLGSATS